MRRDVSPKLSASGINKQVEDRELTKQMKNLTVQIEDLVHNQENALTRFLQDFRSLSNWIISQRGFLELNVKNTLVAQSLRLKENADAFLKMIDTIIKWTEGEKLADQRKLVIKVEIEDDYSQQGRLVKVLEYPKEVIGLVQDVISTVENAKADVRKDEEIENQTVSLLREFRSSISTISDKLSIIAVQLAETQDMQVIKKDIDDIMADVNALLADFQKLDNLERLHLQMLLKLYESEGDSLLRQTQLKDIRQPEDLDYIQEDF